MSNSEKKIINNNYHICDAYNFEMSKDFNCWLAMFPSKHLTNLLTSLVLPFSMNAQEYTSPGKEEVCALGTYNHH